MKVINEWDGEPARTPTQVIRDWYAAYKDEMNWGGIDGFHATELMAALAPLFAAGPWRMDVENAPKDGWVVINTATGWCKAIQSGEWWYGENGCTVVAPIAFATINPPEIEG